MPAKPLLFKNGPWQVHSRKEVAIYENPWVKLEHHEVTHPSRALPGIYGVVRFQNIAVGVLPITDAAGMVPLVGQYRFAA